MVVRVLDDECRAVVIIKIGEMGEVRWCDVSIYDGSEHRVSAVYGWCAANSTSR